MKLTTVCTAISGENIKTVCLRCKQTIQHDFVCGVWFPERPFEPNGEGRGYVYALCNRCEKKIIDKKTGKPKKTWVVWFEDEIKAMLTVERPPRRKIETLGKTSEEVLAMLFGLGHGKRRGEKS